MLNIPNLKQSSTWAGLIVTVAALFGVNVDDAAASQIVMLISGIVGLYEIFRNEKK